MWTLQSEEDARENGRERYRDMTQAQRDENRARIVDLTLAWNVAQDKAFARGWLDEERHQKASGPRFST